MLPDKDFMIEPKDESLFITDIKITQRKIEIWYRTYDKRWGCKMQWLLPVVEVLNDNIEKTTPMNQPKRTYTCAVLYKDRLSYKILHNLTRPLKQANLNEKMNILDSTVYAMSIIVIFNMQ